MSTSSNLTKFLTGVTRSRDSERSKLQRVYFTYRGKKFVTIRFCGGRPELYRIEKDGFTESWMRYAHRSLGGVDAAAVSLVEDVMDPAATQARDLLAGRYTLHVMKNVRLGPSAGEWGTVLAEHYDVQTGLERTIHVTFRLYAVVDRTVRA